MNPEPVVEAWQQLPRRVYFDTFTLQTIQDFGEYIFEGYPLSQSTHAHWVPGLADEIWALAAIIKLNVRAAFQYVVTPAALAEVSKRGIASCTRWESEVADIWVDLSAAETFLPSGRERQDRRFGMISVRDGAHLQEALDCRCQAFTTMERRLATADPLLHQRTGLQILQPSEYWELLWPWAALYP